MVFVSINTPQCPQVYIYICVYVCVCLWLPPRLEWERVLRRFIGHMLRLHLFRGHYIDLHSFLETLINTHSYHSLPAPVIPLHLCQQSLISPGKWLAGCLLSWLHQVFPAVRASSLSSVFSFGRGAHSAINSFKKITDISDFNAVCCVAAHPNSPEAALGAGGGAGGVSLGSETVHGVCLRPDWMPTVSSYSLLSLLVSRVYYLC